MMQQQQQPHLDTRSFLLMLQTRCRVDWSNVACVDELMERSITATVRRCLWNFRELPAFGHVDVARDPAYDNRLKATGFRLALPTQLNWRILEVLLELINQILIIAQDDAVLPFSARSEYTRRFTRAIDVMAGLWFRVPHVWYDSHLEVLTHTDLYLPGEQRVVKLKHAWFDFPLPQKGGGKPAPPLPALVETIELIKCKRYIRLRKPGSYDIVAHVNKGTIKPWRPDIVHNIQASLDCPNGLHVPDADAVIIDLDGSSPDGRPRVTAVSGANEPMFLLLTSDGGKRIEGFYYVVGDACSPYPIFRHHMPSPDFKFGERQCRKCKRNIPTDVPYLTVDAKAELYECECTFPWSF